MFKKLYLLFLIILPKNLLSRLVGSLASKPISRPFIPWFAKRYKINLEDAEKDIKEYRTLNQFFTRRLKDGLRPVEERDNTKSICSPVDGKIAQYGKIDGDTMIQAKGRYYSLDELIGSKEEAKVYKNGYFMTIYLSPKDYHRIHHYCDGEITGYRYIPGYLFPVNPFSVDNVKNLFAVNERFTTYFKNEDKNTAIVKVGATIVGKIKVTYNPIQSNRFGQIEHGEVKPPVKVKKGEELGLFEMGSTVIVLFEENNFKFEEFQLNDMVKLGQKLGSWQ